MSRNMISVLYSFAVSMQSKKTAMLLTIPIVFNILYAKCKTVLWVPKVLLLFYLNKQAGCSEREYLCLECIARTRPLDCIDKEPGSVCPRRILQMKQITLCEVNNATVFDIDCFGQEPLSTIRSVVCVVKSHYSEKPFCNPTVWLYHRIYLNRFYCNENVLEH